MLLCRYCLFSPVVAVMKLRCDESSDCLRCVEVVGSTSVFYGAACRKKGAACTAANRSGFIAATGEVDLFSTKYRCEVSNFYWFWDSYCSGLLPCL